MKKRNKNKEYKPKEMTVDELASITLNALNTFSNELRSEMNQGFLDVKSELRQEFNARFDRNEKEMAEFRIEVNDRFDQIEDEIKIAKMRVAK